MNKTTEHKVTIEGTEVVLALKEVARTEMKATVVNADEGVMQFYASVWGNVDSYGDIMVRGAFANAIEAFKMNGKYPKVVWNHDWDEPLGKTLDMVEDDYGLLMTVQFNFDVQRAREIWSLYKQEALTDFSFGFSVTGEDYDAEGHRLITSVRLYEVSPVLIGANERTHVTDMKSEDEPTREAETPATPLSPTEDTTPKSPESGDEGGTSGVGDTTPAPENEPEAPAVEPTPEPVADPAPEPTADTTGKGANVLSGEVRTLVAGAITALAALKDTVAVAGDTIKALEALLDATEAPAPQKGAGESEVDQHKSNELTLVLRSAQRAVKANTAVIVQLKRLQK